MSEETHEISIQMKVDALRSDLKLGLVWFLNYAALDPSAVTSKQLDLHGAGMLPEDVQKFAHRWLAFSRSVDIEHDGVGRPIHVVESFFNSAEVQAAAWPINSHAVRLDVAGSEEALNGLRSGDLNSISLDALTFNRIKRLPVESAMMSGAKWSAPSDCAAWALELASMGFEGVTKVHQAAGGLYICERSHGLPIGVHVAEDFVDVTPAGGAWGQLAAVLCQSGTLTCSSLGGPPVGGSAVTHTAKLFVVDHSPSPYQFDAKDVLEAAFYTHEVSPFVALMPEGGILPHHVMRGGQEMVNVDAVRKALRSLDMVPAELREDARKHLTDHLRGVQ